MKTILPLLVSLLASNPVLAQDSPQPPGAVEGNSPIPYLSINVDRVVVDTAGLASASERLSASVDRLAQAIGAISAGDADLSDEQKRELVDAVGRVGEASAALQALAQKLPDSAERLGEQLPGVIRDARAPMVELGAGLEAARASIYQIAENLPQATENARRLVDSTLDSALWRLSIYSLLLIAAVAMALVGIMWFVYRQYLDPLARKLDALVGAPEHFDNLSRHMKQTADRLLALQRASTVPGPRGPDCYRHR